MAYILKKKKVYMSFDSKYFPQFFGVIMGTYVAPILANISLAKLNNLLREKCKMDKKISMPLQDVG